MSRSALTGFLTLSLVALSTLLPSQPSHSSYAWKPAEQVTHSTNLGSRPNVVPYWGTTGSFQIHHVYKECLTQSCNGIGALGWYLNVGPAGWGAAAANAHLLTGIQGSGDELRAQDLDLDVDSNNDAHVVFEIFNHQDVLAVDPTYNSDEHPMIGYKYQGDRSWDSDTAIVIDAPWTSGDCLPRRDHGPQMFVQRGATDTVHVAWPTDRQCDTLFTSWTSYTRKEVGAHDTTWAPETFMTQAYGKVRKEDGLIEHYAAGPSTILVDSQGVVHLWGVQLSEGYRGPPPNQPPYPPDTLTWVHFWGTPPDTGRIWEDNFITMFRDTVAAGTQTGSGPGGSSETAVPGSGTEDSGYLYLTFNQVDGPHYIHRVPVGGGYTVADTLYKQITPDGIKAPADALFRTDDGIWHYVYALAGASAPVVSLWHKYVTTGQDPYDATPDGWSAGGAQHPAGVPDRRKLGRERPDQDERAWERLVGASGVSGPCGRQHKRPGVEDSALGGVWSQQLGDQCVRTGS